MLLEHGNPWKYNWSESGSLLQDRTIILNDEFYAFIHQLHIAICYEDLGNKYPCKMISTEMNMKQSYRNL